MFGGAPMAMETPIAHRPVGPPIEVNLPRSNGASEGHHDFGGARGCQPLRLFFAEKFPLQTHGVQVKKGSFWVLYMF